MKKVPAILGPTAVGKSKVAFELALALGGEVLVADSRQVYRRLEIATNKPPPADRERDRYHGLDLVDPERTFNVHQYVQAAAPVLRSVSSAIVEGGTNLYVDALLDGLTLGGVPPRPGRRAELEKLPLSELAALVRRLERLSAPRANRIRGRPKTGIRLGQGVLNPC